MARTDLDAMLGRLGAGYYQSLHGRAARSEVARALDTVEAHLSERPPGPAAWPRLAGDVMTTSVASVSPNTPTGEIARLLDRYRTMPVLERGWKVAGVVSSADLRAVRDKAVVQARVARAASLRGRQQARLTAADLIPRPPSPLARTPPSRPRCG